MSWFGWWKRPPAKVDIATDSVWLSHAAKLDGMARSVSQRLAEADGPTAILLVAQFRETLDDLKVFAKAGDFDPNRVGVAMAGNLSAAVDDAASLDESSLLDLIVAERHPLRVYDDRVTAFADSLPCRSRIQYHIALDDLLMSFFDGVKTRGMLRQLGMREEDCIASPMIVWRIRGAQKKVARELPNEVPAESLADWAAYNLRPG